MLMGNDDFKEFLMEEYKAFNESMHKNEQAGESRLTFFQTLSAAILGVVTYLLPNAFTLEHLTGSINNKPRERIEVVHIVVFLLLLSIFFIGVIIQRRLERRNLINTKLLDGIEQMRDIFRKGLSDSPELAKSYDPRVKPPKRRFTSLADISMIMNTLVFAIIVILTIFLFTSNLVYSSIGGFVAIIVGTPILRIIGKWRVASEEDTFRKLVKSWFTKSTKSGSQKKIKP